MLRNPFKELDANIRKRSSDFLKNGFNANKVVNKRARILISGVFVCFLIIAVRLIYIQGFSQEEYAEKLAIFTQKNQVEAPPRGIITDRNGNVLVDNQEVVNITYYPQKGLESYSEEKWELAYRFAQKFNVKEEDISDRDWKDFYLVVALDQGLSLLSKDEQEKYLAGKMEESEAYRLKIEKVTNDHIQKLRQEKGKDKLSNEQKYLAWPALFKMEQATQLSSSIVVENASEEETAYLIEHKEDFIGFDISTDSKRVYKYGDTLRDVFGKVSNNGLEEASKEYYLARGYALNDRIGISGLEKQYEDYLGGTRTVKEISYDEDTGSPIFSTIQEGKKGYDMELSIDIKLQQKADEVLKKVLKKAQSNPYQKDFKELFFAMMNPNNGEIYVMSGQQLQKDGEIIPYASGNYLSAYLPGSTVKLSTLYMGLNEGVVKPGEIIHDQPMYFDGGLVKKSYVNKGIINDIDAIAVSSNVYMFHIAIRLGGGYYTPYGSLYLPDLENAYTTFRKYYSMFGLGTKTQLDVPFEESGYAGTEDTSGHLLDFAIGQYESYTPIQLLQYVSSVGTGIKVQPHLMKQIYEINASDSVVKQHGTNVLSVVDGNQKYLDRVVAGMKDCVDSQFCGYELKALNKNVAAKSGTAEVGLASKAVTNSLLVGFAPYDQPTISFVCVAPTSATGQLQGNPCSEVVGSILEEYYKTYE